MKIIIWIQVLLISSTFSLAQPVKSNFDQQEAARIINTLADDNMRGRKTFSPEIDKAASFIEAEFSKAGLQFFNGANSFKQPFSVIRAKFISASGTVNEKPVSENNIIAVTTEPYLKITEQSGYKLVSIDTGTKLITQASRIMQEKKNQVVIISSFHAAEFNRLKRFKRDNFKTGFHVIFVLHDELPSTYSFEVKHDITENMLSNVIGILPGKSKKDEYVIFSAHYDHLGVGKPNAASDSIYNGANDDASGTAAVIMLAKHFAALNSNERTIIFTTFTAEESGGYGSRYFSSLVDADKVVAMFNIEMIGTESKWGQNSAYITGYEKSDFGSILQQNLTGSIFRFEADPYPKQNLFYRSDNATLAALGVPAHTISTSKMDSEPYYHTTEDETETLDLKNMVEIIQAIAMSSQTIISGKNTPSRVVKNE